MLPDCWVSVAPLHPRVFPGLPPYPLHSRTVSRHWGGGEDGCRRSRAGFVICPVLSLVHSVRTGHWSGFFPSSRVSISNEYRIYSGASRFVPLRGSGGARASPGRAFWVFRLFLGVCRCVAMCCSIVCNSAIGRLPVRRGCKIPFK